MSHTPAPWTYYENKSSIVIRSNYYRKNIAQIPNKKNVAHTPYKEQKANAEHILRCVNSHSELLEALKNCEQYMKGWFYQNLKPEIKQALDYDLEKLKAAIAKAEGGS